MKSNKLLSLGIFFFAAIMILSSCQKESEVVSYSSSEYAELSKVLDLPGEVYDYTISAPTHINNTAFFNPTFDPSLSIDRANHMSTLGRVIFYDELLSRNATVSCGSCHVQNAGFAHNEVVSEGFNGEVTKRNSLALGTAPIGLTNSYNGGSAGGALAGFSWDDRIHSMAEQSEAAITNPLEMGMTMADMVTRINSLAYYDILFHKAFGEDKINEETILEAVSQFVNSITTKNSKFDEGLEAAPNMSAEMSFANYTAEENLGKQLYNSNCASCHSTTHSFTMKAVANNGLDMNYEDKGKGEVTGVAADNGLFKVPFLRNIELSAPYMHDGRFATLEEVVDHYSESIAPHANLSPELKIGSHPKQMNFSENEKVALVAYLETLTDMEMVNDDKFSDPFRK